ncbi:MAG TPA: lysylphosphatidylglycerol synthase transmembrane domain-containing protein [Streptosporangiaceae bacterium]|nr:lysylphosphatidylglycerol synthase transmembrane domain-containing protein [Streptosporangiaceae bacterium]
MAGELAAPGARRPWQAVVRYLLGAAVGVLVVLLLLPKRSDLIAAWHQLGTGDLAWMAAAIGAETLSLLTFAWLQQRVLRLSGTTAALPGLLALSVANDAIANTVPGEPAVSSAYRYRYYRRRGASGASAGWTIFTILIAQAIGMSLLLLLGVVVALAGSTSAASAGVTVLGLLIVAGAGAILIRRDLVLQLAGGVMRLLRQVTGYPRGTVGARIDAALARMREIPLSGRSTAGIVAIATAVWCSDFLCLLCGFRAVHAAIPWHGVLLAYGVAQVAGSFPLIPGGLGIVEGSLAVVLAAYGAGRVGAVSAALAFRLVNFWLAAAVGWLSVALIARHLRACSPSRAADGAGQPSGIPPAGPASAQSGD